MAQKPAIIYRPFLWFDVKQDIDTMLYNATDILKAYNEKYWVEKRMDVFTNMNDTKEFIKHLEKEWNLKHGEDGIYEKCFTPIKTKKWKFGWTRMHSKLLLDMMMWLSPEFKSKAYDFIIMWYTLAWKRNELKDWYKSMAKAISEVGNTNYSQEATMINVLCTGSPATEQRARLWIDKMKQMDDLQRTNASLIKAWIPFEERREILRKSL